VFAVLAHGNQVFQRVVGTRDGEHTAFRTEVLDEVLAVHAEALQSPIYVGWSAGFLEDERRRFDEWHAKLDESMRGRIVVGHPRALFDAVAKDLEDGKNAAWFE
jgi:hypothetical protein